jgi:hypothetical protein
MRTDVALRPLPFVLGEPRSFRALALLPLFPSHEPALEYVGLDEAIARGLEASEVGEEGVVGALAVTNPLPEPVLLYEGEELLGAKQNRIVERTLLVAAGATLEIPVTCVEQGRWRRQGAFRPAGHAAYPELRRAKLAGQGAAWACLAAAQRRLRGSSPTGAAAALYDEGRPLLEEYVAALPRAPGQAGAVAAIGGRLACLDYVSRPDVFAGLYGKLLRGYALQALMVDSEGPFPRAALGRFLGELELAPRALRPAAGLGEEGALSGYALGAELLVEGEVVALAAFPVTGVGWQERPATA